MGIEVSGICTVVVYVSDLERSRIFYAGMLGFPEIAADGETVTLAVGGTRVFLKRSDSDELRGRHGRVELYLGVRDVPAAIGFLRERGTPILQEPDEEGTAAVLDPDGYPVFLTEAPQPESDARHHAPKRVIVDSVEGGDVTVEGHADVGDLGAVVLSGSAEVIDAGEAVLVRTSDTVHVRVAHDVQVSIRADSHVTVGGVDGGLDVATSDGHVIVRECRGGVKVDTGDGHVTLDSASGRVEVVTGDGHVTGDGLDGAVRVETGAGHVRLSGHLDEATVETGDGEITLDGRGGSVRLETGSGEVRTKGRFRDVAIVTGDGDVAVEWCEGPARIETGSGDVSVAGRLEGDCTIETGDGCVRVELTPDSAVDLRGSHEHLTNRFRPPAGRPRGRLVVDAREVVVVPTNATAGVSSS